MRAVLFGASGMIGGGVLRECLEDSRIESVLSVGRRTSGLEAPKLRELTVPDLSDLAAHGESLANLDVCFYCLGVSAAGMTESAYHSVTHDLTFAIVDALVAANPQLIICFLSGQGADSTGAGRIMWARVKGRTENELLSRSFKTYVFRPGVVQPLKGARSKTLWYQTAYVLLAPLVPVLRRLFPSYVTTTVRVGRAMIGAATHGYDKPILETRDINALGGSH